MTVQLPRLDHLLTLEEWDALPETEERYELVEGVPAIVPPPIVGHQRLALRLRDLLRDVLPADQEVVLEVGVVVDPGDPPTLRVPDLVVLAGPVPDATKHVTGGQLRLVAEVLSAGTRRTDRVAKMHDYAEAGVPWYVLADPGDPPHLRVCGLRDGAYAVVDEGAVVTVDGVVLDVRGPQSSR